MTELEKAHAEIERLKRKLSPLEDPAFTDKLALAMGPVDLMPFRRKFRKGDYIVITPKELARICGLREDIPTLTNIGRSLQAMCWERSALGGNLVFVMTVKEYVDGRQ